MLIVTMPLLGLQPDWKELSNCGPVRLQRSAASAQAINVESELMTTFLILNLGEILRLPFVFVRP